MTKSKYKLLALDMDGTLLNDNYEISEATTNYIRAAIDRGIYVCLSTGRAIQNALPYAEQLGLHTPIITVNGAEVWKAPHDLYSRTSMSHLIVPQLFDLSLKYDVWFWVYAVEGLYNRDHWIKSGQSMTDWLNALQNHQWLKFGYFTKSDQVRDVIKDELRHMNDIEVTNSSPYNLEVNAKGVSKATGLRQICQLLGIQMCQVIAVGDSLNDLCAIQQSGLGVAMGNAQQQVKDAADVVVASNNDDGIVQVIQQYVLLDE